ncbi:Transaldolase [Leucoagaricus sp. SymC.cos]|nr:Transaldolase [Leucoagaricus sp. SymC.cos]
MRYSNYKATDATTNSSLILTAISQPNYSYLIDGAVQYALENLLDKEPKEQAEVAMDYLLVQVGIEILSMIPGRVSISIDPRLAYDYTGIIQKARNLITLFEQHNISRNRILIKIPATYAGIRAAQTLETPPSNVDEQPETQQEPIHTNLTLVFDIVQATACAQAKASVISPFVGRVQSKDRSSFSSTEQLLFEHQGLRLIRDISARYDACGYETQIMAAGFRRPEEVLEVAKHKNRAPHFVTLPPKILHGLRSMRNVGSLTQRKPPPQEDGEGSTERTYLSQPGRKLDVEAEKRFMDDLVKERIALDKVPEALEKFAEDAGILEEKLKVQLMLAKAGSSSPTMPGGWNIKYAEVKL